MHKPNELDSDSNAAIARLENALQMPAGSIEDIWRKRNDNKKVRTVGLLWYCWFRFARLFGGYSTTVITVVRVPVEIPAYVAPLALAGSMVVTFLIGLSVASPEILNVANTFRVSITVHESQGAPAQAQPYETLCDESCEALCDESADNAVEPVKVPSRRAAIPSDAAQMRVSVRQ
ncbi:hypothetical protein [Polyangium aurulentum]|uniref:hypothetical protein n=1 Tax=Polyangium aurulentum TaxID=2567896 RepID=UPI0010AEDDD4|nr:hypothetical protein [Polyangium aurulentum]UQA63195.1 hypothetical protein E8A73_023115 [Polyangium aurulentum]